jgi:uncharacterized membrane protein YkvA (DUF1232 family)
MAGKQSNASERTFERSSANKAGKVVQDAEKTTRLLNMALKKSEGLGDKSLGELWGYFKALLRMIEASARRRYGGASWQSLALALGAIVYFVNPLDFIPDIAFLGGFIDDVTILAYVIRWIKGDIEQFLQWEQQLAALPAPGSAD